MHQENHFPGRVSATDLANPDFVALARAYGAYGELVEDTADFAAAFERARDCGKPALLELRLDPEATTPVATLSGLRANALAKSAGFALSPPAVVPGLALPNYPHLVDPPHSRPPPA